MEGCADNNHNSIEFKFTIEEEKVVSEIAEIFIPRTHTPGAKDLKLENFIILMLRDCFNHEIKYSFLNGLRDFIKKVKSESGLDFIKLELGDKLKLVNREDEFAMSLFNKVRNKLFRFPPSFFQIMKELTVLGYCTSEIGSTVEMAYLPVPGQLKSCINLLPNQKAWSLFN